MSYETHVLAHYQAEAAATGLSKQSTMHDEYVRDSEVRFITGELDRCVARRGAALDVLEIGCGNGYLLSLLGERYPACRFTGLEYSEDLLALARSRELPRAGLQHGDVREQNFPDASFDVVISERVVINLLDAEHQLAAARRLHAALRPGGVLILVEAFLEPLDNLNAARAELLLPPIPPAHHNLNLTGDFVRGLARIGLSEKPGALPPNFLSTHYFVGRVLHEVLRPEGSPIRNTHFVKFFDAALPPATGNYAAVLFRLFEKE